MRGGVESGGTEERRTRRARCVSCIMVNEKQKRRGKQRNDEREGRGGEHALGAKGNRFHVYSACNI